MSRLKFFVIFALLLSLLGLYYLQTERLSTQTDLIASKLSSYGTLDHGPVRLGWQGALHIYDLRFQPEGSQDQFTADRLTVRSDSWRQGLSMQAALADGRLPDTLDLAIRGLRLPLDGDIYPRMMEHGLGLGLGFEAVGCQGRQLFSQTDLANLGYVDLHAHLDMKLADQGAGNQKQLSASLIVEDINWWRLEAELPSGLRNPQLATLGPALLDAQMQEMRWIYEDLGYYERVLDFCAEQMDMDLPSYRNHHLTAWMAAWEASGFTPSAPMRQAYADFLESPSRLAMDFQRGEVLPLNLLPQLISPDEDHSLMVELLLDGDVQGSIDISQDGPMLAGLLSLTEYDQAQSFVELESNANVSQADNVAEQERRDRRFRPVSLAELDGLEGYWVHLTLLDGREREGRLVEVDGSVVRIEQRLSGGFLVIPFSRSNITEIQVLR